MCLFEVFVRSSCDRAEQTLTGVVCESEEDVIASRHDVEIMSGLCNLLRLVASVSSL